MVGDGRSKRPLRDFGLSVIKVTRKSFSNVGISLSTHSKLKPIIKVAKMIKRNIIYILTYFYHRITNA
ncbi:hypothetical protein LEP1GSC024_2539 [Leptospira noguchii str. 2001034031]|uniref:Uncharacterized protein n=1 Tax=Leptospira noguchii str. 2001034031 TaxID=1193053 RepID=M6YTT7_9LEPT|nr:hypothetical protein LEP1GSC024_2539 [Leptospira noguchii str. 2001034031]